MNFYELLDTLPGGAVRIPIPKFLISCVAIILIAGCSLIPQASPVVGQEHELVRATSEPIADSVFRGLNDVDYTAFSRDFAPTMKKVLDEKAFTQMAQSFSTKIGKYQSRQVIKVEQIESLYVITYQARFEKEDPVSARLTLRQGEPWQIPGLWFDSPQLRTQ
jgi:hypothetical protein